jgi:hypothetical protein
MVKQNEMTVDVRDAPQKKRHDPRILQWGNLPSEATSSGCGQEDDNIAIT